MGNMYYGDWKSRSEMVRDFGLNEEDLKGCTILYAYYSYEDYSGSAYVLFQKDGRLHEVVAGHCSCYGLDGQWEPEETYLDILKERNFSGIDYKTLKEHVDLYAVDTPENPAQLWSPKKK